MPVDRIVSSERAGVKALTGRGKRGMIVLKTVNEEYDERPILPPQQHDDAQRHGEQPWLCAVGEITRI